MLQNWGLTDYSGLYTNHDVGEQSLWVVRAGKFGEQEKEAIENNIVTIGWYELPDLSSIVDKNELNIMWKRVYPNQSNNSSSMQSSIVFRFLKGIKIGDLVAIPLKTEPAIFIGSVTSDYEFRRYSPIITHTRRVQWLSKIPKSEIEPEILNYFERQPTVYDIELNEKISSFLNDHGINIDIRTQKMEEFEDGPLEFPSQSQIDSAIDKIAQRLLLSKKVIMQLLISVLSGRHVILAGAVGTGKTTLAKLVSEPNFADAYNGKAVVLAQRGELSEALDAVRTSLTIDPRNVAANENLTKLIVNTEKRNQINFWDFWNSSWWKRATAVFLSLLAIGLVFYGIFLTEIPPVPTTTTLTNETTVNGKVTSTTITNSTNFSKGQSTNKDLQDLPNSYLILVGIIVVILLIPQIKSAKVGDIEIEMLPAETPTTDTTLRLSYTFLGQIDDQLQAQKDILVNNLQ